jgi:hypothetical protein
MPPTEPDRHRRSGQTRPFPPGLTRASESFDADAANAEKHRKLRRNALRTRAHAHALELRHSAYGYALIDRARHPVDGRNDLTLDEVATHLDGLAAP